MIPFLGKDIVVQGNGVMSVLWHRKGQFQTELYIAAPNTIIPSHCHPGIDDMAIVLGGQVKAGHPFMGGEAG